MHIREDAKQDLCPVYTTMFCFLFSCRFQIVHCADDIIFKTISVHTRPQETPEMLQYVCQAISWCCFFFFFDEINPAWVATLFLAIQWVETIDHTLVSMTVSKCCVFPIKGSRGCFQIFTFWSSFPYCSIFKPRKCCSHVDRQQKFNSSFAFSPKNFVV